MKGHTYSDDWILGGKAETNLFTAMRNSVVLNTLPSGTPSN